MSKNMTRKGLAIGAAATLTMSLFSTVPANAAGLLVDGYVSLAPNSTGTSYATLSSEAFDLKSNVVGSLAGTNDKNLKFLIEDPDELIAIDVDSDGTLNAPATEAAGVAFDGATSSKTGSILTFGTGAGNGIGGLEVGDAIHVTTAATAGVPVGYYTVLTVAADAFTFDTGSAVALDHTTDPVYKIGDADDLDSRELLAAVGEADADTHFGTASIPAVTGETDGRNADGSFVVDTETNSNANDRVLRLVNTDATETTTVKVTAWVDDNDDNDIDSTEYVSPTRSVTFYKTSDLTVTTTLVTPVIGDATISGTISITPALNGAQIRTTSTAGVWVRNTLQSGTNNNGANTVTWNTTTLVWDVVLTDDNQVEVGTFTAKAEIADAATGNTASVLVSTREAADTQLLSVADADQTGFKNKDAGTASTANVRKGKSATLVITAYDGDQDTAGTAVVAGKTVNVVLSGATTTTDWTINSVKVLDNAASGTKQYVTDANGQITLEISSTSGANADAITVEARPEGLTGAAAAKATLTWATASYDIVDLHAPANGAARNVVEGGSVSFDLAATDQFGQLMSGDYRLQMTKSGRSDGTDTISFGSGRVTYSVSDAELGAGSTITVATQLQELNTSGVWVNSTDATDFADVTVTAIAAPTTSVVPSVTYSAGTTFDLVTKQIVATDAELGVASQVTLETNTASLSLGAGTGLAVGDIVTVSGAGLWFSYNDGGTIKSTEQNSLTFVLDNAADTVRVHSNTYVKNAVVTMSANGRSGTAKVTSAVAGADSGVKVNWVVPTTTKPGTTFTVKGTLVDAFGNAVNATAGDVKLKYSGPGFVSGSLPTDTDATGGFSFSVLLGSADTGEITVTFEYDIAADGDLLDLGDFSNSVKINEAAAAADTKVNAGSFKGYVAVYAKGYEGKRLSAKVGADWVVVPALASNFVRVVEYTGAGYTIAVRIYIDRVLVDTITVTTK
jgi:hypothetical protein